MADPTTIRGAELRAALALLGIDDHRSIRTVTIDTWAVIVERMRREDGRVLLAEGEPIIDSTRIDVDWSPKLAPVDHYRRLANEALQAAAVAEMLADDHNKRAVGLRAEVDRLRARLKLLEPVLRAVGARAAAGKFDSGRTFDEVVNACYTTTNALIAAWDTYLAAVEDEGVVTVFDRLLDAANQRGHALDPLRGLSFTAFAALAIALGCPPDPDKVGELHRRMAATPLPTSAQNAVDVFREAIAAMLDESMEGD